MSIVRTLLILAIVGLICWVIVTFVPLPSPFGMLIVGVALILSLIWVLRQAGGNLP